MKKIKIIMSCLLLLGSIMAQAQSEKHFSSQISVGGKAGVTFSRISFSPSVPQTMLMGYMAGATFRYTEEKFFGFIVECNVEQRGWKEVFEDTEYAYQRQLTYIQLPILTHIYFGNSKFKGFFNAGPEVSFMIGEQSSSNFDVNNFEDLPDFPSKNRNTAQFTLPISSKFDYGISAGVGVEAIAKKKHSIMLEGRFYYGLGNIFSAHKKDQFAASNGMSVMATLSYMFRIK